MRMRNEDPDEGLPTVIPSIKKPYSHFESQYIVNQIHFYLSTDVRDPEIYTDMIHRILTASEHDIVYIHLNTPGGRLDTGVQLINAMNNSSAKIVTCLEAEAHSLGTLLFLSGDEMVVNDHCMMMFHNYSGGVGGKGHEQIAHLEAETKRMSALLHDICVPFLSEKEVQRIINGEDIWMNSTEIKNRLHKMIKKLSTDYHSVRPKTKSSSKPKTTQPTQVDSPPQEPV